MGQLFLDCDCVSDMAFLEVLTEGLNRVLLVRGGGREVITIYSWRAFNNTSIDSSLCSPTSFSPQFQGLNVSKLQPMSFKSFFTLTNHIFYLPFLRSPSVFMLGILISYHLFSIYLVTIYSLIFFFLISCLSLRGLNQTTQYRWC